jgi:polyisoprenoid-binding protein YceI
MVTKVRGSFNTFEGSIEINGEDPSATKASVEIDVASIDTRNADRDGHLRSNDFLAIEEFPKITFVSTSARQTGDDAFELTGDLTLRGVTQSITIPFSFEGAAKDPFGNQRIGFEGSTVINRKDFGVTFNVALETGGVLVGEKITLEFEISAIRQG